MASYILVAEYPDDDNGKKRDKYPIPDFIYSPYPHHMEIEARNHDEVRAFIVRKVGWPRSFKRVWVNVFTGAGKPVGCLQIHAYKGFDKDESYTWRDARASAEHTVDPRTGKLIGPSHFTDEYKISRLPFANKGNLVKLTAPAYTGYDKITVHPAKKGTYATHDKVYIYFAAGPNGYLPPLYIGLSSHYERGYYDNSDGSLVPIGENDKIHDLFHWTHTNKRQSEAFNAATYREFEKIRKNVLSKYTLVKPIMFADGPYRPPKAPSKPKAAAAKPTARPKAPARKPAAKRVQSTFDREW